MSPTESHSHTEGRTDFVLTPLKGPVLLEEGQFALAPSSALLVLPDEVPCIGQLSFVSLMSALGFIGETWSVTVFSAGRLADLPERAGEAPVIYDCTGQLPATISTGSVSWHGASFLYEGDIPEAAFYTARRGSFVRQVEYFFDALCGSPLLEAGGEQRKDPTSEIVPLATFGHVHLPEGLFRMWKTLAIDEHAELSEEFSEKLDRIRNSAAGRELVLMRNICTLWARTLTRYGVHFDIAQLPGRASGQKITEFGHAIGLASQVDALASGVPFEDVIGW